MKGQRFSEAQVIAALKEHEAGAKVAEICRKLGIVENTFYRWKAKNGGMELSEARRLHELELENSKLKRLLAEAMLDNAALKDVLSKKW
jgi:putative transposase